MRILLLLSTYLLILLINLFELLLINVKDFKVGNFWLFFINFDLLFLFFVFVVIDGKKLPDSIELSFFLYIEWEIFILLKL